MSDNLEVVSASSTLCRENTYKAGLISIWIVLDMLRQILTRNPIRDQLEGRRSDGDAQERDNVRVF